ncbi:MAG TPA: NAD-dependent succinate-semialdehyde dehydrogenase [Gemmatimonadales bacterium]|jgi:succinate-semialdehyde dehydrogenase/glutarate-semialdehyde dehydrogenase|nr:NAD-dependent succinate-semialdehyde dehydrogenase [Gemmatimonadales bacterium]
MPIISINPTTGDAIQAYDELAPAQVVSAIQGAATAWQEWRATSFTDRATLLRATAAILRERKDELARLMALEMGKPVKQGVSEAEKCAWVCDYYAEHGERHLAPDVIATDATRSYVAFQPLGVVLAVMPWNFPLWQVYRFAAPALMAGNAGLLKHASNVPGCALVIEDIFQRAGAPEGLFRTLVIGSGQVKGVIEHPLVRAVTLTGSTPAGRAVASQAGAVLKKTVLELGGSDPYLVLEDADLDHAVTTCVSSRLINSGQSCIAAKRFIVVKPVLEQFTERFVALMATKRMGDPLDPASDLGPQARTDLRDGLHHQVMTSIERGATLALGGETPTGAGAFYPPTVLTSVTPGMPAFDEELFGPVAAIIAADDEADAIRLANHSVFGLGAAVFTRDLARGERVALALEAGATFVNGLVASDPRLPFGGIKESGYGRELGSYGIREFVNIKTVHLSA